MSRATIGTARPAFTLLEILVVTGIISLLVSILVPALSAARQSGKATACGSNLRQLGVGWQIYADQNTGAIVPGRPGKFANAQLNNYWVGNGYQFRPRWYVRMGAECGFYAFSQPSTDQAMDNTLQVDGNKVFLCPTAADRTNNRNYAYGYNFQFLGNTRFFGGSEANGFIRFPVKLDHLRSSTTVVAADAMGTAAGKALEQRTPYREDGSSDLNAVGNHAWSLDPPRLTANGDYCDDNNRAPQHRSAPELRHRNKASVLYADGHAEGGDYESLGYVTNPDGSVAANGGTAHNRLFSGSGRDDDPPPIN